jgi:hypothetical protein
MMKLPLNKKKTNTPIFTSHNVKIKFDQTGPTISDNFSFYFLTISSRLLRHLDDLEYLFKLSDHVCF